jgi:hypothetical protein
LSSAAYLAMMIWAYEELLGFAYVVVIAVRVATALHA